MTKKQIDPLKKRRGIHSLVPNRRERELATEIYNQLDGRGPWEGDDKGRIREVLCEYRHEILNKLGMSP